MSRYIARRLLQIIPVFFGTTFLIYALVFALPGDPIRALGGNKPLPDSVVRELRDRYNLDDPLVVQYAKYMGGIFLRGDFGQSFSGREVSEMMKERWPITAKLALTAWAFEMIFGLLLGILAGLRRNSVIDTLVLAGTTLVISIPPFVIGYTAQIVFGVKLGLFPIAGADDGWPASYLLPAMVLGALSLAYIARLTRTSLVENLRADYIRTAVAKGLSRRRVIAKHALRNSLIPVVTYLGVDLGLLMGGTIVIEGIFNLPGIGGQIFESIKLQEGPVVVGIITLLVVIFLLANLAVDVLYGVLDPRIRYD